MNPRNALHMLRSAEPRFFFFWGGGLKLTLKTGPKWAVWGAPNQPSSICATYIYIYVLFFLLFLPGPLSRKIKKKEKNTKKTEENRRNQEWKTESGTPPAQTPPDRKNRKTCFCQQKNSPRPFQQKKRGTKKTEKPRKKTEKNGKKLDPENPQTHPPDR